MTDPVTAGISLGGMGLTAIGGLFKASGAQEEAQAQQQMYGYQSGIAQMNAKIAKQNADYASQQGEQQAQKYGLGAAQERGHIETAQASSGLDVNSGSATNVRAGFDKTVNMDLTQIRSNAAKNAYNFDVQAVEFEQQSQLYKMAGANASAAGNINADASILGTASSVASEWLSGQQSGLFKLG